MGLGLSLSLVCFIGRKWPSHRERGKSGIFSRKRTGRIFLKERVRERLESNLVFFEREREICSYRFSRIVAVSKKS